MMYQGMPWGSDSRPEIGTVEFYEWQLADRKAALAYLLDHNPEPRHDYANYEIEGCQMEIKCLEIKIQELTK